MICESVVPLKERVVGSDEIVDLGRISVMEEDPENVIEETVGWKSKELRENGGMNEMGRGELVS